MGAKVRQLAQYRRGYCANLLAIRAEMDLRSFLCLSIVAHRLTRPCAEGAEEGGGVFVAEEEGYVVVGAVAVAQVILCQEQTGGIELLLEGGTLVVPLALYLGKVALSLLFHVVAVNKHILIDAPISRFPYLAAQQGNGQCILFFSYLKNYVHSGMVLFSLIFRTIRLGGHRGR